MLRSPWLGPLVIAIAGIVGFVLSDDVGPLELEDVTVTIHATRPAGTPWDFGGGLPDPEISVGQGGRPVGACPEVKDTLKTTCRIHAAIGRSAVHVVVVDADAHDDDQIGELDVDVESSHASGGALDAVELATSGGASAWRRFRALWIALAIGAAIAGGLAWHRRRDA